MKNYGLDLSKVAIEKTDFVLGASALPRNRILPEGRYWGEYLPEFEKQHFPDGETSGCTVWGTLNAIEFMLNCIHEGKQHNFSEGYVYHGAQMTTAGDDPKRIAQWVRDNGLIEEQLLPLPKTFAEFMKQRPLKGFYFVEGQKWAYKLGYEWAWLWYGNIPTKEQKREIIKYLLPYSPLGISVSAWYEDADGLYVDKGIPNTHWCVLFGETPRGWQVFDSYDRSIKILSFDHEFTLGMRYHLEVKQVTPSTLQYLIDWVKSLFKQAEPLLKPEEKAIVENIETTNKLQDFVKAIAIHEGWYVGSRSWKNNNPGNVRFSSVGYAPIYGKVGEDRKGVPEGQQGFAIFSDIDKGWLYLKNFIKSVIAGQSGSFNYQAKKRYDINPEDMGELTILQFFEIYAPREDDNNPESYAQRVAQDVNVSIDYKIKNLLV